MSKEGGEVRDRLCLARLGLSAHDQSDLERVFDRRGRIARRYYDDFYAVRLFRTGGNRGADEDHRLGGKKDRGHIIRQRRCDTYFYRELAAQQVDAKAIPVTASRSVNANCSVRTSSPSGTRGRNYFQSIKSPEKAAFIEMGRTSTSSETKSRITRWRPPHRLQDERGAVVQARTTEVDAVRQAMYGHDEGADRLRGRDEHQSSSFQASLLGQINSSGTFDVIWQSINPVRADASTRTSPKAPAYGPVDLSWVCGGCIEPTFKEW